MGLVGTKAPKFSANAVVNGGDTVSEFSLEQFIDKNYVILFFYPKDFTFVCPSELHAFQEKLDEFKNRIDIKASNFADFAFFPLLAKTSTCLKYNK